VIRPIDRRFVCTLLGCLSWAALCIAITPAAARAQASNPSLTQRDIDLRRLEERAGLRLALRIEQPGTLLQDPAVLAYVNRVAERILAKSDSDEQVMVKVLAYPAFNALSLPGGRIYLTVGLLTRLANEDELAAVLSHEIGHVANHDWANQRIQLTLLRARQRTAWRGTPSRGLARFGRSSDYATVLAAWRSSAEEQADARGLDYLYRAGYDPLAFISVLKQVSTIENQNPLWPQVNAESYGETAVRLAMLENRVSSLPVRKRHHKKPSKDFVRMERRLGVVIKR
jgi:beta-barrel assembly-enhancing protease